MDSTATPTSGSTHINAAGTPTRQPLGIGMFLAITVAGIATGMAYLGMVSFGLDMMHLSTGVAYAGMGVFELALVTVAWLAREAAIQNRPGGLLLFLTWLLSSASGTISAVHELYAGNAALVAGFRFIVPLLAALMWHLALIGDRHLATNTTWSSRRENRRMHRFFLLSKRASRAARAAPMKPNAWIRQWVAARAIARADRAEDRALGVVLPTQMRAQTAEWSDATNAAREARDDLDVSYSIETARAAGPINGRALPTNLASANPMALGARESAPTADGNPRLVSDRASRAEDASTTAGDDVRAVQPSFPLPPSAVARAIAARSDTDDRAHVVHSPVHGGTARAASAEGPSSNVARAGGADDSDRAIDPDEVSAARGGSGVELSSARRGNGGARKITGVEVIDAISRKKAGESWTEIGDALGYHRSTVQRAVERALKVAAPVTPAQGISLADIAQQLTEAENQVSADNEDARARTPDPVSV